MATEDRVVGWVRVSPEIPREDYRLRWVAVVVLTETATSIGWRIKAGEAPVQLLGNAWQVEVWRAGSDLITVHSGAFTRVAAFDWRQVECVSTSRRAVAAPRARVAPEDAMPMVNVTAAVPAVLAREVDDASIALAHYVARKVFGARVPNVVAVGARLVLAGGEWIRPVSLQEHAIMRRLARTCAAVESKDSAFYRWKVL